MKIRILNHHWINSILLQTFRSSRKNPFAFGIFFAINLFQEIILFVRALKKQKLHPRHWMLRHIGMIHGSYIATVTAFLVTNVQNLAPQWLPWLAPTIIGTPIIAYYTRKISKQG